VVMDWYLDHLLIGGTLYCSAITTCSILSPTFSQYVDSTPFVIVKIACVIASANFRTDPLLLAID
jgi:hypothetical protein